MNRPLGFKINRNSEFAIKRLIYNIKEQVDEKYQDNCI
jgi:hypothetical protein